MKGERPTVVPLDEALKQFRRTDHWQSLLRTVQADVDSLEGQFDKKVEALEFAYRAGWNARDRPIKEGIKPGGYYRLTGDQLMTQIELIRHVIDNAQERGVLA